MDAFECLKERLKEEGLTKQQAESKSVAIVLGVLAQNKEFLDLTETNRNLQRRNEILKAENFNLERYKESQQQELKALNYLVKERKEESRENRPQGTELRYSADGERCNRKPRRCVGRLKCCRRLC